MTPRKRKRPAATPPPPPPPPPSDPMDFRCTSDDAWYSVSVRLEDADGDALALRVMYLNFPSPFDERFSSGDFFDEKAVDEFASRFRPQSVQLQDWQCPWVVEGMEVCASCRLADDDARFYNAIVEQANQLPHSHEEGKCCCTFKVLWEHGPLAGETTYIKMEDICLLPPENLKVDSIVENFLDVVRRRLEARNCNVNQTESLRRNPKPAHDPSEVRAAACSTASNGSSIANQLKKPRDSLCSLEDMGTRKRKDHILPASPQENIFQSRKLGQDVDLGGALPYQPKKKYYFFRIENLEKDLSPFILMDFIQEKTSLSPQAFVCPGLLEELYMRGTVLVETKDDADKLNDFLHNPSYIITSSEGRPWVTNRKWCGLVEGEMPKYQMQSGHKNERHSSKIKLVYTGTNEYEKAKLLHTLHWEFHSHLHNSLLPRLTDNERKLMEKQL